MEMQQTGLSASDIRGKARLIVLALFALMMMATAFPFATLHGSAAPLSPRDEESAPLLPSQWMGVFDERLLLDYVKGVKPAQIKIEAIGVDANIEMLEILNGEMLPPSNEKDAGWYKESGRLGAPGNVMIAGHVNWYNTPVAVFGRIGELQEDDIIEVTGIDGEVHTYKVKWVKNFPAFEEPPKQVIGDTSKKVLTLITCGGEWDASAGLYNERTVVRAEEIGDQSQDAAQDDAEDEAEDEFQDIQPGNGQ